MTNGNKTTLAGKTSGGPAIDGIGIGVLVRTVTRPRWRRAGNNKTLSHSPHRARTPPPSQRLPIALRHPKRS